MPSLSLSAKYADVLIAFANFLTAVVTSLSGSGAGVGLKTGPRLSTLCVAGSMGICERFTTVDLMIGSGAVLRSSLAVLELRRG